MNGDFRRLTEADLTDDGTPLLDRPNQHLVIRDGGSTMLISKGDKITFYDLDKALAAIMLKHKIHEITLTQAELEQVDLIGVEWLREHDTGEIRLLANRLPMAVKKHKQVIIEYYNNGHHCWDFFSQTHKDKGTICLFMVPQELENDLQQIKVFINEVLNKNSTEPEKFTGFRPLSQPTAEVIPLNTTSERKQEVHELTGSSYSKTKVFVGIFTVTLMTIVLTWFAVNAY